MYSGESIAETPPANRYIWPTYCLTDAVSLGNCICSHLYSWWSGIDYVGTSTVGAKRIVAKTTKYALNNTDVMSQKAWAHNIQLSDYSAQPPGGGPNVLFG